MSTIYGIPKRKVRVKLGDENGIFDFINPDFFIKIYSTGNESINYLFKDLRDSLPDKIKVYALDNTQQGINTIGDIKRILKKGKKR